ncbi:MAG TPA: sigma-70 family RNA polymerase sigma factor [Solirubrobacteraceae bacterium]
MSALAVVTRPTDHGPDDLDLVAGVRAGDDRAFELLFVRYQPPIAAYVRGMVNDRGRAEDITQEIFISALRRMRETEREIAFKPWIHEIARNACIDAFRRSRTRDEVSFDAHDAVGAGFGRLAEPGATPDSVVEGKVAFDNLCGAIGGLSQTHHEILVMREFEGLSYDEIGERLGLSRAAVESTLSRARRRLSQEYEELVSGERCLRVQRIVDAGGASAVSLRDRRRVARHLAHCQPCRRHAGLAKVDVDAVARRPAAAAAAAKAARIAAFLPLPMFVRRRFGADEATQLLGQQAAAPVVHWSASVAGGVDPTLIAGWTKAVATAAAVAVAGIGAGAAMTERERLDGFVKRVPAIVSQSGPAVSGSGAAGSSVDGMLRRSSVSSGGVSSRAKEHEPGANLAPGVRGHPEAVLRAAPAARRVNGSIRTAEPAGSGLSPPGPGTAPTVPGREPPLKKSIKNIVEKLDLTLTRASPLTGSTASGARGRRSQVTKGRPQRAIRKLIDKLRQVGGGAHADAGGAPATSAEAAPQGLPGVLPASPADTDAAAAPAATPGVLAPPIPTVVADTVSDVSGALTTTLSPAQQPS